MLKYILLILISYNLFAQKAVDSKNGEISYIIAEEPPSLNSLLSATSVGVFLLGHTNEGLLTYNHRGKLVAGVAKEWQLNGNTYTFKIRENALWSDGSKVTAHDFVFAWKKVLDPKTASKYAFIMSPIKNAQKIIKGEKDFNSLAIKAIDDATLEVELEKPCPYFLELVAFVTYFPIKESFYSDKYASDANNLLSNGPFKLTKWEHFKNIRLEKNNNYWNSKVVKLNAINIPNMSNSVQLQFHEFLNNNNCLMTLDKAHIKRAEEKDLLMKPFNDGFLRFIEFNHARKITGNLNFRKAISYAYNPQEMINKVLGIPGNKAGESLFPVWLEGINDKFRKEYPAKKHVYDLKKAQKHIQLAKEELNMQDITISLLSGNSPTAKKSAEYIQASFQKLGITVKLDFQTFKQRLEKSGKGQFDLMMTGWGPDYNHCMTFADLFASWNENNRGSYKNKLYDKYIDDAQLKPTKEERMQALKKVQDLVHDDVVILPLYENGSIYIQHPKLKRVIRSVIGADPWFKYARIEE